MKIHEYERRVYLDNAATTPMSREVIDEMLLYFDIQYGNPSSLHSYGRMAKAAIARAYDQVAAAINASPEEIYFTSGGSESDNWALKGIAFAYQNVGRHIITSAIEHHAVLHTCEWLEQNGFEVTYLPVDKYGMVSPEKVEQAIRKDTILISIMTANNEIGTIQPIAKIGEVARRHGVLFHTDAVQAIGMMDVDVEQMGVDLLSISGHKFHAPKGIGALYVRDGIMVDSLIHGGMQQGGLRAGTEAVASIVGIGKAIETAVRNRNANAANMKMLRDKLWDEIKRTIPGTKMNGHPHCKLPGILSVTIHGIENESLLLLLDKHGIAVSAGSACMSGLNTPSHVLKAIGLSDSDTKSTIRMSLGTDINEADIYYVTDELCRAVDKLRGLNKG